MTRKDFELIASIIADLNVSEDVRSDIAYNFAESLRYTNSRFDRAKFIAACLPQPIVKGGQHAHPPLP